MLIANFSRKGEEIEINEVFGSGTMDRRFRLLV